jgi:TPR repeat protein
MVRALLAVLVGWPIAVVAGAYEDGLKYLDRKSYREAAAAFQVAANRGNAAAERQLGFMYYRGDGFAQNDSKAVTWFERAATHGDLESQVNLGKMYENGLSVAQDDVKAAQVNRQTYGRDVPR